MATTDTRTTKIRAAAVVIAPAVMLAGFLAHPYITTLPDAAQVADAVVDDTARWGIAHLAVAVGSGLMILAFLAIRSYLREGGETRFSPWALSFVVVGSALYAVLPGLEFAPLAAAETGGDVEAVQAALDPWFLPVLVTSVLLFAIGAFGFAKAIAASGLFSRRLTGLVVTGLVVMALARLVPVGVVQFYVQGAAGLLALWPLAYHFWRHAHTHRSGVTAGVAVADEPRPPVRGITDEH